jgi:DNA-binding CsgD family transcriptional regulator
MITFTLTSASIVLAAALYGRRRFIWLKWYLFYQISYAVLLFALTFHYVSMAYLSTSGELIAQMVAGLRLVASAVVLYFYPRLMVEIANRRGASPSSDAVRNGVFLAVTIGIVAPNIYLVYFSAHIFVMRLLNVVMNSYLLGLTVYGIVASSFRGPLKRLMRPFLWLSCAFYLYAVIAGSLLIAMGLVIDYLNALSASLYCFPWSIALSIMLFRHFSFSEAPSRLPPDFLKEYGITAREEELLFLLIQGKSNRRIAESAFISLRTVETHLYNVYRKCDVANRVELIKKIQSYRR